MALLLTVGVGRMLLKCLFFLRRAILYCRERRVERACSGSRPPVAQGQPAAVGSSRLEIRPCFIIIRDHRSRIITIMDHHQGSSSITPLGGWTRPAFAPRWVHPSIPCPAHPWRPDKHLHGLGAGLVLCWLSPRATCARRLEGTRVAGGMARTCLRLSEPTEAAALSPASSHNADKSPWASSRSGRVITEPKGGTKPYLLHREAFLSEVREVPAPRQRGGIVLSGLQEIQPMRGEALCLKPLGSA